MNRVIRCALLLGPLLLILAVSASAQCTRCGPLLTISPKSLVFAGQTVGTRSAPLSILLRSSGAIPLTITNISTTGPFTQTNNCPALLSNRACSIQVVFVPKSRGILHGTVVIHDNVSPGSQVIPLTGIGQ